MVLPLAFFSSPTGVRLADKSNAALYGKNTTFGVKPAGNRMSRL